jgi:REP element-mobilizing transposase RayT
MLHLVWCTKDRIPLLTANVKSIILNHIRQNAKTKGIFIDTMEGHLDHIHALIGLNAEMSISKVMQLIKGESSFWINRERLFTHSFEWAVDYFAISVSPSSLERVRNYIRNQEHHHQKLSFKDEYEQLKKHGEPPHTAAT